jgi:preprotein translocase subunit SecF
MIDILGKRYYFFALSLIIIIPSLTLLGFMISNKTLPLAIDFTGGSLLEISFEINTPPQPAEIINLYNSLGVTDATVQTTSQGTYVIRSTMLSDEVRGKVINALEETFNAKVTLLRFESVGPTIGREVTVRAAEAVAVAAAIVLIYMTFAFRGIPHALRYGTCAIIAMIHDIAIVFSLSAIGTRF